MSLDAMKQALSALEQYTNVVTSINDPNSWVTVADGGKPARDAISVLRAAIEQAQELVCVCGAIWEGQELVSTPLPRQWQGLTDEEIKIIWRDIDGSEGMLMRFARAIETKLKEKNA